ncbi:MAG: transposase [Polyangiales bacterium]
MSSRRARQQSLPFHGGRREGAGRKKDRRRNLVTHAPRAEVTESTPVHVTLRVRPEVWNLRSQRSFFAIEKALLAAREAPDVRVVHYSVQGNHVHMVVEATDRVALARRVKGFAIRVARAINHVMKRRGSVFADRYHTRVIASPRDMRNVLAYVLKNRRHHVGSRAAAIDRYSSADRFDGWDAPVPAPTGRLLVDRPASWLLRTAWRRYGPIPLVS